MKRILLALSLMCSALLSNAQYLKPGSNNPIESWSPMWNTSNTYFGTVLPVAKPTNAGAQLDTVTNTGTVILQTSTLKAGAVAVDTFIPVALNGGGDINLTVGILKCTGTPTVTVTFLSGSTPESMVAITTASVITTSPTSLTVPTIVKFTGTKRDRYYGISVTGSASSTVSVRATYYYIKSNYISIDN